ncbi:MAG: iron-containing alcohol dehydrogenase, partial [Anaerotignum sp.]|nr:iron-containing alcohol dehydrogenase [Anaerotignum sp.]
MRAGEKVFCRVFQAAFRAALPVLPYREPEILKEVKLIPKMLRQKKIRRVLLVTDTGVRGLGLTNRLELGLKEAGIHCAVYDKVVANPTIINIEEARKLY